MQTRRGNLRSDVQLELPTVTIAPTLRVIRGRMRFYSIVAWKWLTFRRGTRPRRIARRIVLVSSRYVLARPPLRRPAHAVVRQAPLIERHLRQLVNPRFPVVELGRRGREVQGMLVAAMERRAAKSP
jgi:hypothetical protein